MSVLDRQPASAYVVATEPTRLLAMDEEILWSLVHSSMLPLQPSHQPDHALRRANAVIATGRS